MNAMKFDLFIDGDKYEWRESAISGAQVRQLGSIPEGVEIFLKVPGKTDQPILDQTSVDLEHHHGPAKFSTQSRGSQAG